MIALLTLPAAISFLYWKTPASMMVMAVILGLIFTFIGIYLSFEMNLPSGATIILISGLMYLIAMNVKRINF